jgi:invasion protein IalB
MTQTLRIAAGLLVALLGLALPATAQTAGGAGAAERQPGQPYVAGTEGAWQIRCISAPDGAELCQIYQLLSDQQGNPVAEITLFDLPDGEAMAMGGSIIVPLETLLTAELAIQIDDGEIRSFPFAFCNRQGCIAPFALDDAAVAEMRAGLAATVTVVPAQAPDQIVRLVASLIGFTDASARIAQSAE